eukprot:TRINITY_DN1765_c9_g1_i1.p1 TRINITY_DN1765_c9_g1~~TRINITY_DN1765_c9_g1_i1.p1  ORF type:complete len:246 (+),score=86.78 TRINITY_DN1765_c9_g1_i1:86-739(+)
MSEEAPAAESGAEAKQEEEAKADGPRPVKLILLGDSAVGKTKLVERYLQGQFCPQHDSTHALTWFRHAWEGKDGKQHLIDLWDTAGQERFNKMHASYYDGAHSAILCFDVLRKPTYKALTNWLAELRQMRPDIPVVVAANKVDMDPSAKDKQFAFASKNDLELLYVSAADGTNVVDLFELAIQNAVDYQAKFHSQKLDQLDLHHMVQEAQDLLRADP